MSGVMILILLVLSLFGLSLLFDNLLYHKERHS